MTQKTDAEIRHVHERWHETIVGHDLDGLMALYAEDDAILETPWVQATLKDRAEENLKGNTEIRSFFEAGLCRFQNELARWYRTGTFFSNGRRLTWESPRDTPQGDQVDLVEVMDIANGLNVHHRVYWEWIEFKALIAASNTPAL